MQFNGHSSSQDCVSEILKICGATTSTYSLNDITRRFNAALDDYFALALKADKRWQFDDLNESAAPIVTQNIASGTNAYDLTAFSGTADKLDITKLEILDSAGNQLTLDPETIDDLTDSFGKLYSTSVTGTPTNYLKLGKFIYLRPTPNYNSSNGLKGFANRAALYMASNDTTKVPGVPVIHHTYLCRKAALPFLIEKNLPQAPGVLVEITKDEKAILDYYGNRNEDMDSRLTPRRESNR